MTTLNYTRVLVDGQWDIDSSDRVNANGEHLHLAKEIEAAIPGEPFKIVCDGSNVSVIFTNTLTQQQQDDVDSTVAAHKANTLDAPMWTAHLRNKIIELVIEANTYIQANCQYDINRQVSLENRLGNAHRKGKANRKAYIESLDTWIFDGPIEHYRAKKLEVLACTYPDLASVKAVTADFAQYNATNPLVTVDGALDIDD